MPSPEIQCPKCGSLGWFIWVGLASGSLETDDGELGYPIVEGEEPGDDDTLSCQDEDCEYEGTVAEFKAAAKKANAAD